MIVSPATDMAIVTALVSLGLSTGSHVEQRGWEEPSGESRFEQGEKDMGDKGKKDKGKKEQKKKAQLNLKEKRKLKKEKKK